MDHFGGHVIESARAQLGAFAFACQHSLSGNMVCDSLAVCQCFRTWIAFDVRTSRLLACVCGSTRRKQISGEFSPRLGIILSHFRSDKFLKIGPSLIGEAGSVVCAPVWLSPSMANPRKIEDIAFMVEPIGLTLCVANKSCRNVR
jgi:hypothetical protein